MPPTALIATRKGLFTLACDHGSWSVTDVAFAGDNCPMVLHHQGDTFAALDHGHFGGKLHKSSDGGRTWSEITCPAYPEKPDDAPAKINDFSQKETPWALKLIWCLESASHPDYPDRLYCGTIPGGLFHSDDRGESWQLNLPLWLHPDTHCWFGGGFDFAGIHSMVIDPRDPDHIALGVSCGGVWITNDSGKSWQIGARNMRAEYMPSERANDPTIQDPHLIVSCPANVDRFWTQHHNGIFRSDDFGESWTEVTADAPSRFGFAVAVHPNDPDTAWFVPAIKDEKRVPVDGKFVVTRTRDGGKTLEVITKGLPQNHAYDLVFRHALAVDDTGDCLVMGTTTGNVYVSQDSGDSWECVATTLPPVYAIRLIA